MSQANELTERETALFDKIADTIHAVGAELTTAEVCRVLEATKETLCARARLVRMKDFHTLVQVWELERATVEKDDTERVLEAIEKFEV